MPNVYWIVFVAAFLAVAVWETLQPLSSLTVPTGRRWRDHAVLFAVSAAFETIIVRLLPAGAAALVQNSRLGILNNGAVPFAFRCVITIVLFDLLQYWIHRYYHYFDSLWRIHEVHHSDADYDVSIAIRFHPLEVLPSQLLHTVAALLLAPPAIAVLISQMLGMLINIVVHANARFPNSAESALRTLFITPDLHRVHHSADAVDHARNFGQTFSFWDRLFGTYAGHSLAPVLRTGVDGVPPGETAGIFLLTRPFRTNK